MPLAIPIKFRQNSKNANNMIKNRFIARCCSFIKPSIFIVVHVSDSEMGTENFLEEKYSAQAQTLKVQSINEKQIGNKVHNAHVIPIIFRISTFGRNEWNPCTAPRAAPKRWNGRRYRDKCCELNCDISTPVASLVPALYRCGSGHNQSACLLQRSPTAGLAV